MDAKYYRKEYEPAVVKLIKNNQRTKMVKQRLIGLFLITVCIAICVYSAASTEPQDCGLVLVVLLPIGVKATVSKHLIFK